MNPLDRPSGHESVPLSSVLRDAAQELRHLQPPDALRDRIAARWRAVAAPPPRWRLPVAAVWSGAAVCALAFGVSLLLLLQPPGPQPDVLEPSASGFVPLVGPERWRQLTRDSATPAWLVTTEMPRERLAAIGLPFDPARAAEPVRAELLMHASGDVIALRVIGR
jgi:hypothetical protein